VLSTILPLFENGSLQRICQGYPTMTPVQQFDFKFIK
jgi:hypothetical protein